MAKGGGDHGWVWPWGGVARGRGDHGWGWSGVGMTLGGGVMRYKVNMKGRKDDMVEFKNNHMKCVHCKYVN